MKKWILRLLVALVVAMCFFLFALKIVSGTGDAQKRGLEQAFSEIFEGRATFGQLVAFNLFPQLSLAVDNLAISNVKGQGDIVASKVALSFATWDIVAKNRKISGFHLTGLNVSEGVYTPMALSFDDAGIYKGDAPDQGVLSFSGHYGEAPIKGRLTMQAESGLQPKYYFGPENPFTMNLGAVQVSGVFMPYVVVGGQVSKVSFLARTSQKAKEQTCALPPEQALSLPRFFKELVGGAATLKSSKDFDALCRTLGQPTGTP